MTTVSQFLKNDQLISNFEKNAEYDYDSYVPLMIITKEHQEALDKGVEMYDDLMSRGIDPFSA